MYLKKKKQIVIAIIYIFKHDATSDIRVITNLYFNREWHRNIIKTTLSCLEVANEKKKKKMLILSSYALLFLVLEIRHAYVFVIRVVRFITIIVLSRKLQHLKFFLIFFSTNKAHWCRWTCRISSELIPALPKTINAHTPRAITHFEKDFFGRLTISSGSIISVAEFTYLLSIDRTQMGAVL